MKTPNNKTSLCISLSAIPGNTGSKLHNSGYRILGLNYIYIPLKCTNHKEAIKIINNLEFKGCSLSMPLKQKLLSNIDFINKIAQRTGSINTILKKRKKLYGFNTDYYSLKRIINEKKLIKDKVLLLGNGGVAKTSYEVLKDLKFKFIFLSSRDLRKYKSWSINKNSKLIEWKNRNKIKSSLLINATPIGMKNATKEKIPITKSTVKRFKTIIDFTIHEDKNNLEKISKKLRINYISGYKLSFYQGVYQFRIYTGKKINENKLKKTIKLLK